MNNAPPLEVQRKKNYQKTNRIQISKVETMKNYSMKLEDNNEQQL